MIGDKLQVTLVLHQQLLQAHFQTVSLHPHTLHLCLQLLLRPHKLRLLLMDELDLLISKVRRLFVPASQCLIGFAYPKLPLANLSIQILDFQLTMTIKIGDLYQFFRHVCIAGL